MSTKQPATGVLQAGLPLRLALNVSEITGTSCLPVAGCFVDIWQCNALGLYSDVTANGTLGQKWLRGHQVSDEHGNVRFLTIYPGWYNGRTVHIHFRVRKFNGSAVTFNFTSQLYFSDAISNAVFARAAPYSSRPNRNPASNTQDNIYNPVMLTRLADNTDHLLASFNIVINANPGLLGSADAKTADPKMKQMLALVTPTDEDSLEHANDFGGGSPFLA
jgi:protocatechuate 3,4-dioxygenase beta subunit